MSRNRLGPRGKQSEPGLALGLSLQKAQHPSNSSGWEQTSESLSHAGGVKGCLKSQSNLVGSTGFLGACFSLTALEGGTTITTAPTLSAPPWCPPCLFLTPTQEGYDFPHLTRPTQGGFTGPVVDHLSSGLDTCLCDPHHLASCVQTGSTTLGPASPSKHLNHYQSKAKFGGGEGG